MTTDLLLVQLLVLGATGALFWLARRDLSSRAPSATHTSAETPELEQLCITLEALVTDLSRRLDRVERQLIAPAPRADDPRAGADPPAAAGPGSGLPVVPPGLAALSARQSMPEEVPDARHALVYALMDAGEADSREIARRSGLSPAEVDLILSLRARRAL